MGEGIAFVDVGNTAVAWRLWRDGRWAGGLERAGEVEWERILAAGRAVVVSSSPEGLQELLRAADGAGVEVFVVGRDFDVPMEVGYRRREELGKDRLCNAYAAARLYGTPVVSCSVGTCVTVEAVDEGGRLVGGAIAAGMPAVGRGIAAAAGHLAEAAREGLELARRLAGDGAVLEPGRSTVENIAAGIVLGAAGALERLARWAKAAVGARVAVATGGDAFLARFARGIEVIDGMLTLEGLRLAWEACE